MKKLLPTLLVSSLILTGCGLVEVPSEEDTSIDTNTPEVEETTPTTEETVEEEIVNTEVSTQTSTYTHETLGYNFRYNSEYKIENQDSGVVSIVEENTNCPLVSIGTSQLGVDFAGELKDLELRLAGTTEDIQINGLNAKKRSGGITENISPCGEEQTQIIFEKNGEIFVISSFKGNEETLQETIDSLSFE